MKSCSELENSGERIFTLAGAWMNAIRCHGNRMPFFADFAGSGGIYGKDAAAEGC